jgi:hypothetical protein
MSAEKDEFLKSRLVPLLRQIPTETPPQWGKMTLQQMIEHFSDSVRIASGKTGKSELVTPEDKLPGFQAFLMSDKPFKENTMNPLMPEIPAPVRNKSLEDALNELEREIEYFFSVFDANEHLVTTNPFFGELNYQMNVQLLYKHSLHHLKQFGVEPKSLAGTGQATI